MMSKIGFFNMVKFNHLDSLMEYYRKLNNPGGNNDKSS